MITKTGHNIHVRQTLTMNAAKKYRYIEICIYNWRLVIYHKIKISQI